MTYYPQTSNNTIDLSAEKLKAKPNRTISSKFLMKINSQLINYAFCENILQKLR